MSIQHPLKKFHFRRVETFTVKVQKEERGRTNLAGIGVPSKQKKAKGTRRNTISFNLKFGYPVIIQSFKITKKKDESSPFEFDSIDGNLLGDMIDYEHFLETMLTQKKIKPMPEEYLKEVVYYKTSGVGEVVRMNFKINHEYWEEYLNYSQSLIAGKEFDFWNDLESRRGG